MMRVSKRTRYGLRALAALAEAHGGGPVSVREIAESQHLPVKYLERLFVVLKASGLVIALRGAGGGYVLAQPPEQTRLLDVFEVLEGPPDPVECLHDEVPCPQEDTCATRHLWQQVSRAVSQVLADHTLADLGGEPPRCDPKG